MNSRDKDTAVEMLEGGERSLVLPGRDAWEDVLRQAHAYVANGHAANTRAAYSADWAQFTAWCREGGWQALPATPELVALYITAISMQGRKLNTITRRLAAINFAHVTASLPSPTTAEVVQAVVRGIRRTHGSAPQGVDALLTEDIIAMVQCLPPTLVGRRDKAIILLGFAGAFRRSELVAMNVCDLEQREAGLVVTLRRSKTDQEGHGRLIAVPYGQHADTCPVLATLAWIEAAGRPRGAALFPGMNRHDHLISDRMSGRAIADVIKRATTAAGLADKHYSPHSLRAGHCTTAARAGVEERVLMQTTGHKSSTMVRRYVRSGALFQECSGAALGL